MTHREVVGQNMAPLDMAQKNRYKNEFKGFFPIHKFCVFLDLPIAKDSRHARSLF